jgi:glutathione S-transferase
MAPTLAYWDIRGLAEPIRLLLVYTGTEFEDKRFITGDAPGFDKSCWFDIKYTFGLDFPNLPYYIDGDVKLTQTNAILRHISRKNGLDGKTDVEKDRVDLMENQVMDFRNEFVRLSYNPDFENLKEDYLNGLDGKLKAFSDFLGERPFFAGDHVTHPDFHMYEMLWSHNKLSAEHIQKLPKLVEFMQRIEALPKVADYVKSDKFLKTALNNKMAAFGKTA